MDHVPDTVELHAIDVSSDNFPKEGTFPANVRFSLASVTKFPSEWTNKFDFINQRLLFLGLLEKEWPVAISELFRVLKPGGAATREHFTEPELRPLLRQAVVAISAAVESYVAEKASSLVSEALKMDPLPPRLSQMAV